VNTDVLYFKDWIVTHKDSAFKEYVTSLTAADSAKTVVIEKLRNFLYKTIKVVPTTDTKYTKITIKSGTMKPNDFLIIYDGDDPLLNTMLAQMTGTLSEKTFLATTTKGLTIVVRTGRDGKSESGFTFEYSEVKEGGTSTNILCPSGYTACTDKYYCLNNKLFCDEKNEGQCIDASDEAGECPTSSSTTDKGKNSSQSNSLSAVLLSLLVFVRMIRTLR